MPFYYGNTVSTTSSGNAKKFAKYNSETELVGIAQSGIISLINNSSGIANNELQGLPDLTNTPLTIVTLRDEIVNNLLPPLRNNFTDLSNKINEIGNILINQGLFLNG